MITLKNAAQLDKMRESGKLLFQILNEVRSMIKPGVTSLELDRAAEKMIRDAGAIPSFLGYNGFPYTLCISPDEQVVHGFPRDIPLQSGQVLSVDAGLILNGWQADSAFTVGVGTISQEAQRLIDVTEESFFKAVEKAYVGNRLGDISYAVQKHAEANGYSVIRDLCGHGIGTQMHEEPEVPNFGAPGRGVRLVSGMVLAIEPMVAMGNWPVTMHDDGWTVTTRDKSLCAHYEHTVAITDEGPELFTYPGYTGGNRRA